LIDRSVLRKEGKLKEVADEREVNTVLYVVPSALKAGKDGVRLLLEYETHKKALASNLRWQPFYRAGLLDEKTGAAAKKDLAMRFLGYVPISPDLSPEFYDVKRDEVFSKRHGSLRQPRLAAGIDAGSPLGKLLDELALLRADLRFREDGLYTTVTLRRR
jgi:hypothetical protein